MRGKRFSAFSTHVLISMSYERGLMAFQYHVLRHTLGMFLDRPKSARIAEQ